MRMTDLTLHENEAAARAAAETLLKSFPRCRCPDGHADIEVLPWAGVGKGCVVLTVRGHTCGAHGARFDFRVPDRDRPLCRHCKK
jgi:hypothetical protein